MSERFVIDNSIVMTWCFKDEANRYADAVLNSLTDAVAIVPAIWPLEVVNVLLVAERRQRLHEADSVRFISLLSQLPIVIDRTWPERMMKDLLALGREYSLSSYDAAYLELAMRQGLPLASLDSKLLEAAKLVDVPILDIETRRK
jgi:predicted nucleic acid-binding protein